MRVLVVDDDPIYRETARMFLAMYGRNVTLAENGTTGVAKASEAAFDIMIVDMEMPDMTGLEVIAHIRKMPHLADMPIIMVTSRDDAMAIDRAFELGASSFVVKPVNWTLMNHYLRFVLRASENEMAARQAQAHAESLARTKDQLLTVLRHEMKTPLNAIIGFTKLAEEAQASGNLQGMHAHLSDVVESGQRLLTSFADMSTYSDLISERIKPNLELVSPAWLVDDALESKAAALKASGLHLQREDRAGDAKIRGDAALLTSVLMRLIDNAILHAREAQNLAISTDLSETGEVVFTLCDDGDGMEPEAFARCLEPFSQADMSLSRPQQGLGLGLPIANAILGLHGGRLTLDAAPVKGVIARAIVPRA